MAEAVRMYRAEFGENWPKDEPFPFRVEDHNGAAYLITVKEL